jgi:predicted O-methyltransferase YrrM
MDSYLSRWQDDEEFVNLHKLFNDINGMNNPIDTALYARLYILRQLAKQQANNPGNFVECGTYAGMSIFFVSDLCQKRFIGIDSFLGVSEPGIFDSDYFKTLKLDIPMEITQRIVSYLDRDDFKVELYKGWIPEVFNSIDSLLYSYVHIDTDLYQPTKDSIEKFWPLMLNGGVLICDDYGSYKTPGARKAMIDFFGKNSILELPTGQAIVYKH